MCLIITYYQSLSDISRQHYCQGGYASGVSICQNKSLANVGKWFVFYQGCRRFCPASYSSLVQNWTMISRGPSLMIFVAVGSIFLTIFIAITTAELVLVCQQIQRFICESIICQTMIYNDNTKRSMLGMVDDRFGKINPGLPQVKRWSTTIILNDWSEGWLEANSVILTRK